MIKTEKFQFFIEKIAQFGQYVLVHMYKGGEREEGIKSSKQSTRSERK
jgi:hypothetical protein